MQKEKKKADMNSETKSKKDLRVPTFVQFDVEKDKTMKQNNNTKRKRTTTKKNDDHSDQPTKKKVARKQQKREVHSVTSNELDQESKVEQKTEEPTAAVTTKQIWVGAVAEKEYGAFSVFFGSSDDERNVSSHYERESELQDLDYAFFLGTLQALELVKSDSFSYIIHTGCRALPRSIAEGHGQHYQDLVNQIRALIDAKKQDVVVRHISSRTRCEEQASAMDLAESALPRNQVILEAGIQSANGEKQIEELAVTAANNNKEEKKEQLIAKSVQKKVEQQESTNKDTVTITTTTTTKTTKIALVNSNGSALPGESMDIIEDKTVETFAQEEQQSNDASTSWMNKLSFSNLLDVLSSPFRNRN